MQVLFTCKFKVFLCKWKMPNTYYQALKTVIRGVIGIVFSISVDV